MKKNITASELSAWMATYIADLLGVEPSSIDRLAAFEALGLDSSSVAGLTGDLGDLLQTDIDPTIAYDHNSIQTLANALAAE
jgi:acyl carrier protein